MQWFDFTDASMKGDHQWAMAAKWTSYGAYITMTNLVLTIVEIVLGVLWLVELDKNNSMSFAQVIQPLIIPGLAFFNAIPSAHLHILARANPPKLAVWFSNILWVLYLTSAVVWLASCNSSSYGSLQQNECPAWTSRSLWDAMVACHMVSAVCYGIHAAMAVKVYTFHKKRNAQIADGSLVEVVDEEAKARREEDARERWRRIVDL